MLVNTSNLNDIKPSSSSHLFELQRYGTAMLNTPWLKFSANMREASFVSSCYIKRKVARKGQNKSNKKTSEKLNNYINKQETKCL